MDGFFAWVELNLVCSSKLVQTICVQIVCEYNFYKFLQIHMLAAPISCLRRSSSMAMGPQCSLENYIPQAHEVAVPSADCNSGFTLSKPCVEDRIERLGYSFGSQFCYKAFPTDSVEILNLSLSLNQNIHINAMNANASLALPAFWYANWFWPTQAGRDT